MSMFLILFTMISMGSRRKILLIILKKIKDKVFADKQIQNYCSEIANLSENVKSFANFN